MLKKMAALVLAIALVPVAAFSAPAANAAVTAAPAVIKVEYNKKQIAFPDQSPVIRDGRTLVPIRPIAESLGFEVEWNEKTRTVTINKGTNNVKLVVSQKIAKKNGQTINLDVPAQIINKRTVVPVRFIAEALSYNVNWDGKTQTVLIADSTQAPQPEQPNNQGQKPAETPKNQANLVNKEKLEANKLDFMGVGFYAITGKVEPDSKVTVTLDGKNFEVDVKSDGSFVFEYVEKLSEENYTIRATKAGEEEVIEGKFHNVE